MTPPITRILNALATVTVDKPARNGAGWKSRCPAHDSQHGSLAINEGEDGRALLHCFAGCTPEAVVSALGLTMRDLMPADGAGATDSQRAKALRKKATAVEPRTFPSAEAAVAELERQLGKHSAEWTYHDGHFEPAILVLRWDHSDGTKSIRPVSRTHDGWIIGALPKDRPLYHLPELSEAQRVYVCEGEKAADAVRALGLTATTSSGGCKAAAKTDWAPLTGKEVVICPDNDKPGAQYPRDVARLLAMLKPT